MHATSPARRARHAAIVALCSCSLAFAAQRAEPFTSRAGEHFRVVCHFEDEVVAGLALEAAEAAWPLAAKLYGVETAPAEPYRIHLLPDVVSYGQLEARLTYGAFASNLAFSSFTTKESYVAMQPQRAQLPGWPELPMLTRRLIAHEATHLVLYHADPGFASHPSWLSEGIAELVSDEVMRSKGWAESETRDPFTASRLEWLRARVDGMDTAFVDVALRNAGGYALHGALLSFLQRREGTDDLRDFLERCRDFAGESEPAPWSFRKLFHVRFAPEGTAKLEDAFRAELRSRAPLWFEEGRSLERASDGEGWVQIAFESLPAIAWRVGEDLAGVKSVRIELEIARLPASSVRPPSATIYLGGCQRVTNRPLPTSLAIDLAPDHGVRARSSSWPVLEDAWWPWPNGASEVSACRLPLDRRFEILLRLEGEQGAVAIDGENVLDLDLSALDRSMHLGLCTPRGGLVRWRELELVRAR